MKDSQRKAMFANMKQRKNFEKGQVFPKESPYFILHDSDILESDGSMRLGKIKTSDAEYFIVEDPYMAARYHTFDGALKHFKDDVRINKEMRQK